MSKTVSNSICVTRARVTNYSTMLLFLTPPKLVTYASLLIVLYNNLKVIIELRSDGR